MILDLHAHSEASEDSRSPGHLIRPGLVLRNMGWRS